jgi:hypothetical protein
VVVEIPLTRGMIALVDDEDAPRVLEGPKWRAVPDHRTYYAQRYRRREDGVKTTIKMHALITGQSGTDHINGNGLDNRRSNLRVATVAQNLWNQGLRVDNTSGYKGVYPTGRRWRSKIVVAGKRFELGVFDDPADAARAYDQAAREHFGEFAWLNFREKES